MGWLSPIHFRSLQSSILTATIYLNPLVSGDAGLDGDSDGLTNLQEFLNNTNPKNADSDDDGLTDGVEVIEYGTEPLNSDTDNDGYSDGEEVAASTNPKDPTSIPMEEDQVVEKEEDEKEANFVPMAAALIVIIIVLIILFVFFSRRLPKIEKPQKPYETKKVLMRRKGEAESDAAALEEAAALYGEPEPAPEEESAEEFECPECGAALTDDATLCPSCGTEFEEGEEEEDEEEGGEEVADMPEEEVEIPEEEAVEDMEEESLAEEEAAFDEEVAEDLEDSM
jgi:hypothetical protein